MTARSLDLAHIVTHALRRLASRCSRPLWTSCALLVMGAAFVSIATLTTVFGQEEGERNLPIDISHSVRDAPPRSPPSSARARRCAPGSASAPLRPR